MKISCSKEALLMGVNNVQRAVSNKNTLPVLQGILLKAHDNYLEFTATDLELGIRCQVDANVLEDGALVLPARLFSEIVRKLPDTTLGIEMESGTLKIEYYQSNIVLKGIDPEDFPLLPDFLDDPVTLDLSSVLIKNMIRQTVFACAAEESRPVFTGTLLQLEEQSLRLVATDTHRLAYRIAQISNHEEIVFSGIIPAKTMTEIYRLLRDEDEIVHIRFNKSQISFQFGQVILISRLIEGQFPNYIQVIPKTCQTKLYIETQAFLEGVERASLMARDSQAGNIVRLNIEDNQLRIDQISEIGQISEQLEIMKDGQNINVSFNAKLLMDALKIIDKKDIVFELSGPFSAGVIRPIDDPNYLYLVLPVRTA